MSKTRLEAFTDAVIAILMTLLVLELSAPEGGSFLDLWALRYRFAIYAVSFVSLAIYWNNHHHLFQIARRVTGRILWVNTGFLFCLSMLPFATAWVDEHLTRRAPQLTYGVVVLAANILYALLARSLARADGPDSPVARALAGSRKSAVTLALNVAGLAIGFFVPVMVLVLYIVSLVFWVAPERRIEREFAQKK